MALNLDERAGSKYPMEASFGTRFVTYMIDSICIAVLMVVIFFIVGFVLNVIMIALVGVSQPNNSSEPSPVLVALFSLMGLLLSFAPIAVFAVYYIIFEHYFQRTIGKFATGTIVVDDRDGRPTFGQIVGRTFCRLIPFEPLIAFFTTSFLHDTVSGTKVIIKE